MRHYFAIVLYLSICMLGNCSCFYFRLQTFFKIKFLKINHPGPLSECQTVWIKIKTDILLVCIWVQTVCKRLLADDKIIHWHAKRLQVNTLVFNILSHIGRDVHAYVCHKKSDTLNTFNMLCPLNKAKVIFKVSS